ncbi:MAG: glycosyltransferase [Candidatus Woesearchaeota archaeon]
MNIAVVCDSLTFMKSGNIVSTLRFAELLNRRGHKIVFISSKDGNKDSLTFLKGMKVYRFFSMPLPGSSGQYHVSLPTVSKLRKVLVDEKIELVHLIDPTLASLVAIRAAGQLGIKKVAHGHTQPENLYMQLPKIFRPHRLTPLIYWLMLEVYHRSDALVCPSEFAGCLLRKQDPKLEYSVISNGVDLKRFRKSSPVSFMKKYGLSTEHKHLLFVGRLSAEKNIETLIRAMPHILSGLKDAHLVIVGSGKERPKLESLVNRLGLKGKVDFLGRIPDEELHLAYNAACIFVLPSMAELEGMVVLEAMACGKPILVANSRNSASVELVQGNGFAFKPKDPKDLASKALILLTDQKLMSKMSKQSLRNSKHYDISNSVTKLEKLFVKVIS